MDYIEDLGLTWVDALIIIGIGVVVFALTYIIYPPIIKWLKHKGWVGYDIHKHDRPETAESGGVGLTIGMVVGLLLVGVFYPILWNEVIVFEITIIFSALVGFYDDRKQLSSIKKILLMFATGIPIFVLNLLNFITVDSPILPILGKLRLPIIYPFVIPFIMTVMTNTVNMLEGYNGEGSGTTSISVFFIVIAAIIAGSAQGILFGVPVLAAILAFFFFNRYPAKVFPGDIGTLVIGAAIGLLGILGSLEIVMIVAMFTQIFNSFYVLASVRGFKESHDIKKKDIWLDDEDLIHASHEHGAPLTLPRLILAKGPTNENRLVNNFLALSVISGLFAILSEVLRQWSIEDGNHNLVFILITVITCIVLYGITIKIYPRIFGISIIMILLLLIGVVLFFIIEQLVMTSPLNWLYSFILAGVSLIIWYFITIKYFWYTIKKAEQKENSTQ